MRTILLVFLVATIVYATYDPPPPPFPATWPSTWYTWVVTTIVQGSLGPIYNKGQLLAFDLKGQVSCRFDQQDLITKSTVRPADMCDHTVLYHYSVNDTASYAGCNGMSPLTNSLSIMKFPDEFISKAQFVGIDRVNSKNCNHFLGTPLTIDGKNAQMDVWIGVDDGYPCQISMLEIGTDVVSSWAFDGFTEVIPQNGQCSSPELICKEADWVCHPKAGLDDDQLGKQLQWVCDPTNLDCTPINPGGAYFEPNTVQSHCNWAFDAYFKARRGEQGTSACNFGGTAELVPPTYYKKAINSKKRQTYPSWSVFPPDVICPSNI